MKSIDRTIVSAILLSSDNKVLIGKIREGGVYPDCWHFPGGGVDYGETKEQALNRRFLKKLAST